MSMHFYALNENISVKSCLLFNNKKKSNIKTNINKKNMYIILRYLQTDNFLNLLIIFECRYRTFYIFTMILYNFV